MKVKSYYEPKRKRFGEELLNGERVKMLLSSKKDMFKGYLISSISESNYKVIMDSIKEKKETIVDFLYNGMKKNIENNKKKIADMAVEGIGNVSVEKIVKPRTISKIIYIDIRLSFCSRNSDCYIGYIGCIICCCTH